MEAKGVWSVIGLSFDLVGAFLLSVPLIWNIDALIKFAETQACVVRKGILRTVREGLASRQLALWAAGSLFVAGLALGGAVAYVLYPNLLGAVGGTRGLLPTMVGLLVGWLLSVGFLVLVASGLSVFLQWVRHGQYERRVGQIGFFLLVIGFVCQAIVNFL